MRKEVTLYICDKCGFQDPDGIAMELRTPYISTDWHNNADMGPAGGYSNIDLCDDCKAVFLNWLGVSDNAIREQGNSEEIEE